MGKKRGGLSVAQEIDGLEQKLSLCRQSMKEVDLKLRRDKLSPEGRDRTESAPKGKSQERSSCSGRGTTDCCYLHLLDDVIVIPNSHYQPQDSTTKTCAFSCLPVKGLVTFSDH
ncbi:coiled-coil domain-containing protein 167 isoform X1 [Carettochelys insculpta]|uniref:coiled-coil domain-containing protein 167 isoform X1 n=1 Tax=Carettochelys insculpta TaxID=44489 RepID=UPI003EBE7541